MQSTHKRQLWGIVLAAGEGTRVREFLMQLCGGRGIKQFCAVTGRRSMLQHTLDRTERLIPRDRILIVVSKDHQAEVEAQLAHWPAENVIFQPANRDTAPGILLPLAHVSQHDPLAEVGWSDWGSVQRICNSLARMGKRDELFARLRHHTGSDQLTFPFSHQLKFDTSLH